MEATLNMKALQDLYYTHGAIAGKGHKFIIAPDPEMVQGYWDISEDAKGVLTIIRRAKLGKSDDIR